MFADIIIIRDIVIPVLQNLGIAIALACIILAILCCITAVVPVIVYLVEWLNFAVTHVINRVIYIRNKRDSNRNTCVQTNKDKDEGGKVCL